MTSETNPPTNPRLRAQAETALQGRQINTNGYSAEDIQRLVYELQVHQIELELQNEELRRSQQEYEILYEMYADLFDSAPVGYFTVDETSQILAANQTGLELLGTAKEQLAGHKFTRFVAPDQQDAFHRYCQAVLRADQVQQADLQLVKADGTRFYASLEGQRLPAESYVSLWRDAPVGRQDMLCKLVVSDITPRRRMEEELQALYELAKQDADTRALLLRELDHRVRNNLNIILGLLHLEQVRSGVDSEAAFRARIDEIRTKVHAIAVVHTLLSDSVWEPIVLDQMAREIIGTILKLIPTDCWISLAVPPAPVTITSRQANNLALVLSELTTNAIKYAFANRQTGQVQVAIAADGPEIRLEFRDDGPGFSPEVLALAQTGQGWSLIREIVRHSLDGAISLHNDGGAVAVIRFPDLGKGKT